MKKIFEYTCYRDFVSDYIISRQKVNSKLSLRSFALKFDLSPSHLSQVLSGKKTLSESSAFYISEMLNLDVLEKEFFILLVAYENAKDEVKKFYLKKLRHIKTKYETSEKEVATVEHIRWEHLYALVLAEKNISEDSLIEALCKQTQISDEEAERVVQSLIEKELLDHKDETLSRNDQKIVFTAQDDHQQMKLIHAGYLDKSTRDLTEKSTNERFSVTEFIHFPPSKFEQLKNITNDYLDEISQLVEDKTKEEDTEVLGICLHLNRY